jgi:hypothetical protein
LGEEFKYAKGRHVEKAIVVPWFKKRSIAEVISPRL